MTHPLIALMGMSLPAADASAPAQQIVRAGEQASAVGPAEYFTGRVRIDPVWPADGGITAS